MLEKFEELKASANATLVKLESGYRRADEDLHYVSKTDLAALSGHLAEAWAMIAHLLGLGAGDAPAAGVAGDTGAAGVSGDAQGAAAPGDAAPAGAVTAETGSQAAPADPAGTQQGAAEMVQPGTASQAGDAPGEPAAAAQTEAGSAAPTEAQAGSAGAAAPATGDQPAQG